MFGGAPRGRRDPEVSLIWPGFRGFRSLLPNYYSEERTPLPPPRDGLRIPRCYLNSDRQNARASELFTVFWRGKGDSAGGGAGPPLIDRKSENWPEEEATHTQVRSECYTVLGGAPRRRRDPEVSLIWPVFRGFGSLLPNYPSEERTPPPPLEMVFVSLAAL